MTDSSTPRTPEPETHAHTDPLTQESEALREVLLDRAAWHIRPKYARVNFRASLARDLDAYTAAIEAAAARRAIEGSGVVEALRTWVDEVSLHDACDPDEFCSLLGDLRKMEPAARAMLAALPRRPALPSPKRASHGG